MALSTISACGEFTIADLHQLPDDGHRYELIGGSIVMNPAPLSEHQRVSRRLQRLLEDACPPGHEVFDAPIGLLIDDSNEVEPDLLVVPTTSVVRRGIVLPVLLVVELISPGSVPLDRVLKRDLYARCGIEHYWLVDTRDDQHRFEALRLEGGEYVTAHDSTSSIDTDEPIALRADLASLFGPR